MHSRKYAKDQVAAVNSQQKQTPNGVDDDVSDAPGWMWCSLARWIYFTIIRSINIWSILLKWCRGWDFGGEELFLGMFIWFCFPH